MEMTLVAKEHYDEMGEEIEDLKADLAETEEDLQQARRENGILWQQVHAKNARITDLVQNEGTLRHQATTLLRSLEKNNEINQALVRNLELFQATEEPQVVIHDLVINVNTGDGDVVLGDQS